MLPAREASAPFGIRIVTGAVCSKESGIDSSRMFMTARSSAALNVRGLPEM